jgi:hypothetical protein
MCRPHVMGGVPIAVVVKAAGFLEDSGELDAAGTHVVDGWIYFASCCARRNLAMRRKGDKR